MRHAIYPINIQVSLFYTDLHLSPVISLHQSLHRTAPWKVNPLSVYASFCVKKNTQKKPKYTSVIELLGTVHCWMMEVIRATESPIVTHEWQRASGVLFQVAISSTLKQALKCL